ncbi:MAG: ATP-binding protein [Oscillospiraceae bacterium]|nr:ATP-binding protein [Oscillospiraceae bacterium]
MLYTQQNVRDNIRNREGVRVFFLDPKDTLTPGARDYLTQEKIPILPASEAPIQAYHLPNGATLTQKPEHMTHLHGDVLVSKTHPRIAFRGAMDTLEAELLLCAARYPDLREALAQILALARHLLRCEVLSEPVKWEKLCGLTEAELRSHSHHPQDYYGQPHFMPEPSDPEALLVLNRCRTVARAAELSAAHAFTDPEGLCTRSDLLQALNRISSMLYILMIQQKSQHR